MKNLTVASKFLIALLVVGIFFGAVMYVKHRPKDIQKSAILAVNDLPALKYDASASAPIHNLPDTTQLADNGAPIIRAEIMGWNAQAGVLAANGGVLTVKGSIMDEQGVRLKLICQNDCGKQGADLLAFAVDYSSGNKNSSKGCPIIAWMGDGVPGYLAGLNEQIKKQAGADYTATVFYASGASFGEDKFIVSNPNAKGDPKNLLKGMLVAGVIMDGDWNIAMQFCNLNQIPINNDLTTYDPDALNWRAESSPSDYLTAAQDYVNKVKETRHIVKNGKLTGRDTTIMVNGCVTWFPGDKNAFDGRGGVTLASTKDFSAQMPCIWIAPKKWLQDNRALVEKFILAGSLGGDQVKSHTSWLTFASQVANDVYQDKTMSKKDWQQAFIGMSITDAAGNVNEVGGSRVFNLADEGVYFGFSGGGEDKYQAIYTTFGDLDVKAYPDQFPAKYPKYDSTVDLTYMMDVWSKNKNNTNMTAASMPTIKEGATMSSQVGDANYSIEFDLGSAVIKQSSYATLDQIRKNAVVADALVLSVIGHTDNTGNSDANITLSQARANAVKEWLTSHSIDSRKITSNGVGANDELKSVDPNTKEGRAKNRRVEIKFGRV